MVVVLSSRKRVVVVPLSKKHFCVLLDNVVGWRLVEEYGWLWS